MKISDIKSMDKDDILDLMGLQTKGSTTGWVLGTFGTFAVGILVGAGLGMLLAPRPGRELRDDIRTKLRRGVAETDQMMGEIRREM